jgi:hypothetical protein
MDSTAAGSSYNSIRKAYEVSLDTINSWRKRIVLILILGVVTISVIIAARVLFFDSSPKFIDADKTFITDTSDFFTSVRHYRSSWENFGITCFFVIGAVISGLLGRRVRVVDDAPALSESLSSEKEYEVAVKNTSEEIDENDELIHQQKKLAALSFGLFLASDVMLMFI